MATIKSANGNDSGKKLRFEHVIHVRVTCVGQTVSLKGLVDSGNQLRDPLTNTPVMIVELQPFAHIFPQAVLQMIQQRTYTDDIPSEWVSRIRFVPYRAVGVEQQLLVAIKPDEVQWSDGKQWTSVKKRSLAFLRHRCQRTVSTTASFIRIS